MGSLISWTMKSKMDGVGGGGGLVEVVVGLHTDSNSVQLVTACDTTISGVDTIWQTYKVSEIPCDSQTASVWQKNNEQYSTTKRNENYYVKTYYL